MLHLNTSRYHWIWALHALTHTEHVNMWFVINDGVRDSTYRKRKTQKTTKEKESTCANKCVIVNFVFSIWFPQVLPFRPVEEFGFPLLQRKRSQTQRHSYSINEFCTNLKSEIFYRTIKMTNYIEFFLGRSHSLQANASYLQTMGSIICCEYIMHALRVYYVCRSAIKMWRFRRSSRSSYLIRHQFQ